MLAEFFGVATGSRPHRTEQPGDKNYDKSGFEQELQRPRMDGWMRLQKREEAM